jgi:tRNA A-37 threonylcarbamoyl transferase component Bud32
MPLVGSLVCDKWRVSRELGKGGMATVYEAAHRNGKRVALKVLHANYRSNERVRARFLREGYIANRVNHCAVPSVFDDGETEAGDAFLVMDLLQGETLEARKARPIAPSEALRIAAEVLSVLASAHQLGIVHRDIKPANLFLTTGGRVAVLDFGIATVRELLSAPDSGSLTQPGFSPGTPSFMAPEQARGRAELVDARTDIWAVGAVLFNLLTGRPVHQAGTNAELMIAAATSPAAPIAALRPDLPRSVAHVIDRALAFHPELRWHDAEAMLAAIAALSPDLERADEPPPPAEITLLEAEAASTTSEQLGSVLDVARGGRLGPSLLLIATALCLVGAGAWGVSRSSPRATRPVASVAPAGVTRDRDEQREAPPAIEPAPEAPPVASASSHPPPLPARATHAAPSQGVATAARARVSANKRAAPSVSAESSLANATPITTSAPPAASGTGLWGSDSAWLERQK